MMKSKKLIVFFCGMLILGGFIGTVSAQDVETNVVAGNTYGVFFITPLDVFSSDITFDENGTLTLSSFGGRGLVIAVGSLTPWFRAGMGLSGLSW